MPSFSSSRRQPSASPRLISSVGVALSLVFAGGCVNELSIKEVDVGLFPPDGAMALRGEVPIQLHGQLESFAGLRVEMSGKVTTAECVGAEPTVCELPGGNHFGDASVIEVETASGVVLAEVTPEIPLGEAMALTGPVEVRKFGRLGVGKEALADSLAAFNLVGVLAETSIGPAFLAGGGEPESGVVDIAAPGLTTVLPVAWDGIRFTTTPMDSFLPATSNGKSTQLRFLELQITGERSGDGFEYVVSGVLHPDAWATVSGNVSSSAFQDRLILDIDTDGDGRGDTVSLEYSGHAESVELVEWLSDGAL